MIDKLADSQISQMEVFRDKWIKIGLCTEPANRPEAEAAINQMYKSAGLMPPKKIVWCGSPLSQGLTRAIILGKNFWDSVRDSVRDSVGASVGDSVRDSVRDSVGASVGDSVGASVGDSVGDSVWASVRDSVGASVWDSVWASVWDSVWDSVWASVGDSVGDSVRDSVRASVWDSVGASVWDSVRASGYGQHDANWLAFYEFFRLTIGLVDKTEKILGHIHQAKSAGWYLPHQHVCWVSERHSLLERDERGRLHSVIGPAVLYPDGWAIYAVHGVRVPADIITDSKSITTQRIEGESNQEIKRVMIEIRGWEWYLKKVKAKVLHTRKNDVEGTNESLMQTPQGQSKVLVCACPSTAKVFALEVPAEVQTCEQAQQFLSSGLSDRIIAAS